jgi:hypothetical protein
MASPTVTDSPNSLASTPLRQAMLAESARRVDPASLSGDAPNYGEPIVPHIVSFAGMTGALARVYMQADEAVRHSLENARFMRNDVGVMECIEARQRLTALLGWHLEPEDESSQDQKALCDQLTKILGRIRRFTEMRRCLMEAIWFGRYAVQHQWRRVNLGGKIITMPSQPPGCELPGWAPIHGDKLVFRAPDDDSYPVKNVDGEQLGSVGVRVNVATVPERMRSHLYPTNQGMCYFLPQWQRPLMTIHRHSIEDAAFEDPLGSGAINGVGIRSRIYWEWFQKQECLGFLLEYLERSAFGIEIWEYPLGNKEAETACRSAAMNRSGPNRNIVMFPKPQGEDAPLFDVRHVEPGMAGAAALQELLEKYFGHRVKRYILGQTLSSEADATGLGSGVADIHMDTLSQIIEYDAGNLEETLTHELVLPLIRFNFPRAAGIHVRFKIDTKTPDARDKMDAYMSAWQMGARIKESDVLATIGAGVPTGEDVVLQNNPQQGGPGLGGDGDGDGLVGEGENGQPGQPAASWSRGNVSSERWTRDFARKLQAVMK